MEEFESKNYALLIENIISTTNDEFNLNISEIKKSFNNAKNEYLTEAGNLITSMEDIVSKFNSKCEQILNDRTLIYDREKYYLIQNVFNDEYKEFVKKVIEYNNLFEKDEERRKIIKEVFDKIDTLIKRSNELFKSKNDYKKMKSNKETSIISIEDYKEKLLKYINDIELVKVELRNAVYFSDKSDNEVKNVVEEDELVNTMIYYNMLVLCRDILINMYNSNTSIFNKKINTFKPFDNNNYTLLPDMIRLLENGVIIEKRRQILYELYYSYVLEKGGKLENINDDDVNSIKYSSSKLIENIKSLIINKLNDKLSIFELVMNDAGYIAGNYFYSTCDNSESIGELLNYYINIDEICNNALDTYKNIVLEDIYKYSNKYYELFKRDNFKDQILRGREKQDRVDMLNTLIELSIKAEENRKKDNDDNEKENIDLIKSIIYLLIFIGKDNDLDGKFGSAKHYLEKHPVVTVAVFTSVFSSINIIYMNTYSEKVEWSNIMTQFESYKKTYNEVNKTNIDDPNATQAIDSPFLGIIVDFLNRNIKNISKNASRLLVVNNNVDSYLSHLPNDGKDIILKKKC